MLKFKLLGSGEYLRKGLDYLFQNGYAPSDDADLLVCLAHPKILKQEDISQYALGCINFHCGLPKYRGRHPLQWMLIEGVKEIPCAVHFIDEGIDTGPIVSEKTVDVDRNETYASALDKVTDTVGPLLVEAFDLIEQGFKGTPQNDKTLPKPRRTPEMSEFTFDQPSADIHHFINALSDPMPNAFCNGIKYKQSFSGQTAGEIVAKCTDGRLVMATADGVVLVEREWTPV